jgi:hypothetical protein
LLCFRPSRLILLRLLLLLLILCLPLPLPLLLFLAQGAQLLLHAHLQLADVAGVHCQVLAHVFHAQQLARAGPVLHFDRDRQR